MEDTGGDDFADLHMLRLREQTSGDSLDMVELICDLEEACEVDFGEPEGLVTVGDLVAYIDSL